MARPSRMHKGRLLAARLARSALGLGLVVSAVAWLGGMVPLMASLTSTIPAPRDETSSWWLRTFVVTLVCYLLTSTCAVIFGGLLGGLTAKRGHVLLQNRWHTGVIRRGLELTGALPNVVFCAIWLNSHPDHALPALLVVTVTQQIFEVGARVRVMVESPGSNWNDLWYELCKSSAQVAVTLASGEIALIVLKLASPNYATWPSSVASCLRQGADGLPAVLILSLLGTLLLPVVLFLAGPVRPASR
jgi:hypothetical protein